MAKEKIDGVFFESKVMTQGTGHTARDTTNDIHYYCRSMDEETVELGMVDFNGKSTGLAMDVLALEEFLKRLKPCTEHDCEFKKREMDPKKRKADEKVKQANKHLENKEYLSAEFEFGNAIKMDEENVKANYGLGKTYLEQGKVEEAKGVFEKLSHIEALFETENKHVFNEFGIDLRKNGLYDQAIHNYEKAIKIDPDDGALYYNIARVYKEMADYGKAAEYLQAGLAKDPEFQEASKYLNYIRRLKEGVASVEEDREKD